MSLYSQRGVSAQKEEVLKATEKLEKGLYAHSFCKIYPDWLGRDPAWVNLIHADGAGSKTSLAYLYWKETGDVSVWKGIAKDAIAMNLDDLLCVGIYDNLIFSSTIDRNKKIIPGEVLESIIHGSQEFFDELKSLGINIHYLGGETADAGDIVRSIAVNGTMACRWPKDKLITNEKIRPGDVIIGLASFGQADYEKEYNSGIGSNGLTSARHDLLHKSYGLRFPESYDSSLDDEVIYIGPHRMTEEILIEYARKTVKTSIGKLLLSPTRTYAPVMKSLFEAHFDEIHGLVHCSGGGQTKCLNYLAGNYRVIKDNLFKAPPIFQLIKESSHSDNREMYQVFNMGHRLEIFTSPPSADEIIAVSGRAGIEARIVGRVEAYHKKELLIKLETEEIIF